MKSLSQALSGVSFRVQSRLLLLLLGLPLLTGCMGYYMTYEKKSWATLSHGEASAKCRHQREVQNATRTPGTPAEYFSFSCMSAYGYPMVFKKRDDAS
jgi:hypothetical protein